MTITITSREKRDDLRGRTILALCGALERAGDDEIMVVLVAGGDAPKPNELTHWMAERMPHFMVPRNIRVVAALPKTPTECVQKNTLRDEGITPNAWDRDVPGVQVGR
ncbi:MAG: hypothetical protein JHC53_04720 [Thermoleophilia bacterium]|nr:hypothetical protein [Thermoleophilia bacterium]